MIVFLSILKTAMIDTRSAMKMSLKVSLKLVKCTMWTKQHKICMHITLKWSRS